MTEHCLFVLKPSFLDLLKKLNCAFDFEKGSKRPVFCCLKDEKIENLYWAIPTSDLAHRTEEQIKKYNEFISKDKSDLRSCYYHIGKTTKLALFKISSCFPITDEYVDHEYTSCQKVVVLRNKTLLSELERKLRRILAFESTRPNYFPQHITDIKNALTDSNQDLSNGITREAIELAEEGKELHGAFSTIDELRTSLDV